MACRSGGKSSLNNMRSKLFQPGLSLIEMLVSIAVVLTVASLFIANYRTANQQSDLVITSQKLVADIHFAQNNTLGLVNYGIDFPAGGWGVYFDKLTDSYLVFADLDAPGEAGYREYNTGEGTIADGARLTELASNMEIYSIIDGNSQSLDQASVTFLPPDPVTNIYSDSGTSSSLTVTFRDLRSNQEKSVRVNFLGLAEVMD